MKIRSRMCNKGFSQLFRTTDIFRIAEEILQDDNDEFSSTRTGQVRKQPNEPHRVNSKEVLHTLDFINNDQRMPRTIITDLITPHRSFIFPSHAPSHNPAVVKRKDAIRLEFTPMKNDEISQKILKAEHSSRCTKFPESRKNYLFASKRKQTSLNVQTKQPETAPTEDELADKFRNKEYSHIIQYTGPFCKYVRQSKPNVRNLTTFEDCLSRFVKEMDSSSPHTDTFEDSTSTWKHEEGKRRRSQIQAATLGFSPSGGLVRMYGSYSGWFIDPSSAVKSPQT
eukprot:748164-Hanusia_phi.AAC.1